MTKRIHVYAFVILGAIASLLIGQIGAKAGATSGDSAPPYDGASTSNCNASVQTPAPASSAGFSHLAFCDDFDSLSTIDVKGTGAPGFNWYTRLPPGRGGQASGQTLPSAYSVSHSMLTVTSTGYTANWGLTTRDPVTGNGDAWNLGYFEARIKFDPALGTQSRGWPSFWSISAHNPAGHSELDFFEAYTGGFKAYPGEFLGTLHEWQDKGGLVVDYMNTNKNVPTTTDWHGWHVIGCRWLPHEITWYLDGKLLITQQFSATAPPDPAAMFRTFERRRGGYAHLSHSPQQSLTSQASPPSQTAPPNPPAPASGGIPPDPAGLFHAMDSRMMQVIVGSSPGWPMYIDWVRVWVHIENPLNQN